MCEVDSFPPPESFKWSFNNTAETFEMPQSEYKVHSSAASTLSYTPVKELDFGTILCWAENIVGQQKEPCVFHLIAAGKPDTPYNCTIVNQTSESLEVECTEGNALHLTQLSPQVNSIKLSKYIFNFKTTFYAFVLLTGFDGGQRQWFVMEIFDSQTNILQANISSKYSTFHVNGKEENFT